MTGDAADRAAPRSAGSGAVDPGDVGGDAPRTRLILVVGKEPGHGLVEDVAAIQAEDALQIHGGLNLEAGPAINVVRQAVFKWFLQHLVQTRNVTLPDLRAE